MLEEVIKKEGKYDQRNRLNDLTGKEWLKLTKSFWFSKKSKHDKFSYQHPAPFLIKDVGRLIAMYTKQNMTVLDPFCGLSTTSIACNELGRKSIGIDLNPDFCKKSKKRLEEFEATEQRVMQGDAIDVVPKLEEKIDYCVTSPPYHNILKNKGGGIRKDSDKYRSAPRNGVEHYGNEKNDLGNQDSYEDFLNLFKEIMNKVYFKLREDKYTTIIISDFTVEKKEKNVQGDVVNLMQDIGYKFAGTTVLLQNTKPLYPFGYPYAYKINHHHQNLITFRKRSD
jgi:DNA modification methylase